MRSQKNPMRAMVIRSRTLYRKSDFPKNGFLNQYFNLFKIRMTYDTGNKNVLTTIKITIEISARMMYSNNKQRWLSFFDFKQMINGSITNAKMFNGTKAETIEEYFGL